MKSYTHLKRYMEQNMTDSMIFSKTVNFLDKAMALSAQRNSLISSNIANMDTIGYVPRDIDFQKELEKQTGEGKTDHLSRTNRKHMQPDTEKRETKVFIKSLGHEFGLDRVDLDSEMSDLAENQMLYRMSAEMVLRKMSELRDAITEGGK